ncbi:DUF559 domain-containing protein [Treponema sp. C6A8]|uniref:DUF559 domain-containing protein n=1 Tax=Treponema sp. C6A8 TaxID=1410609 RepID=UPI00056FA387|nr:DUF559 domain-containing protein [Treponema sp. C6A8]
MGKTWGFIRETTELAIKAGKDKDTGLIRTGLNEYLEVIFPNTHDWIHNKSFGEHNGQKYSIRPDYRSESLKLIVEFDGLPHYENPDTIEKDEKNQKIYESCGYKVVRIPYFIQLSNDVVKQLFGVTVNEPLFDASIPSLGINGRHSPAYLCPAGIRRMAKEFLNFPEQYKVNLKALKDANIPALSGVEYLEEEINKLKK